MINQRLWIPVGHFTSPINAVVLILRDLDIDAVWRAADDAERRMLVEELIEWVTVFPDHLEVPSAIRIQKRMSRVLHWIGDVTSRSTTAVVVVVLLVIFGVILPADGFPMSWEAAFSTIAGAVTLVMLFVVQHTQGRNHLVL